MPWRPNLGRFPRGARHEKAPDFTRPSLRILRSSFICDPHWLGRDGVFAGPAAVRCPSPCLGVTADALKGRIRDHHTQKRQPNQWRRCWRTGSRSHIRRIYKSRLPDPSNLYARRAQAVCASIDRNQRYASAEDMISQGARIPDRNGGRHVGCHLDCRGSRRVRSLRLLHRRLRPSVEGRP